MNKTNTILAVALIVQIGAILAFASPFGGREVESVERTKLFDGVDAASVLGIRITDDEGNTAELAKEAGAWVLASADGYPVDEARVTAMIDNVVGVQGGRPVTRKAKNHKKLEVAEGKFSRKVELTADGGKALGTFYLGSSPNYNQNNVRAGGSDVVYLATGLSAFDFAAEGTRWVDTQWLELEPDDITSVRITRGDESIAVSQGVDGAWQMTAPEAMSLPKDRVDAVLRSFRSTYLDAPVGKDDGSYGFDNPTATVESVVTMVPDAPEPAEGEEAAPAPDPVVETYTIEIGGKTDDDAGYYVKRSGFDFVATLTASSVEQKFLKSAADFQPAPEEEAGAGDGAPADGGGFNFDLGGGEGGGQ